MPEESGDGRKWTAEQVTKIQEWLDGKWGKDKPCPLCGNTTWLIGDFAGHVVVGANDGTTILGKSYPFVVVICENCGTAQFVNAIISSIQAPKREKEAGNG